MPARRSPVSPSHPVIVTFLIFAVIAFMSLAAEVLKPLALAVLLSFALVPLAGFFERRGLPRTPAVILTLLLVLGILVVVGFKVGQQLTAFANDLPKYEENITRKINWLIPRSQGPFNHLEQVGRDLARTLDHSEEVSDVQKVSIVSSATFTERLRAVLGPTLGELGELMLVLILVLFILIYRDDLSDRIIGIVGQSRVSLTTRTKDEAGQRISRYLGMYALVNSSLGLIAGIGLWAIGVQYGMLWGVLFALLRFIPYVGTAVAVALPLLFSFATFNGWREPILVIVLFGSLEAVAASFMEPVIYGRATGLSALGLLVSAMFWTWLWGGLGLLLSTPLTVCLAVLGKYVPGLKFFATLLGEEAPLEPDVRFYQRVLEWDQDGAIAIVEAALKEQPREVVFDKVLIPALSRTESDRAHADLDEREQTFLWRVVGDLLGDLETAIGHDADQSDEDTSESPALHILGIAGNDQGDELALWMLEQLLPRPACRFEILVAPESHLALAEQVAEANPDLVFVSDLPPAGFTATRYLVRRLRARFARLPIVVGRWCECDRTKDMVERLTSVGATQVVFRLDEARDLVVQRVQKARECEPATP
jgi:predicted PurR-regulated permease PerM